MVGALAGMSCFVVRAEQEITLSECHMSLLKLAMPLVKPEYPKCPVHVCSVITGKCIQQKKGEMGEYKYRET